MALKFVIDRIEDVETAIRPHYTKSDDGRFRLATDGEHPDTARIKEFRETSIAANKKLAAFEGVDADEYKSLKTKIAAGEIGDVGALRAELATEKSARAAAQAIVSASVLKTTVGERFIKAGGRGSALDYMVSKAAPLFDVVGDKLVGKVFDPDSPGIKLTVDSFLNQQARESDFAFYPSSGGGADPMPGGTGRQPGGANELVNPSPQQLGQHASDIKSGRLKVRYTT